MSCQNRVLILWAYRALAPVSKCVGEEEWDSQALEVWCEQQTKDCGVDANWRGDAYGRFLPR